MWFPSGSLNSGFCPVSNSTASSGATKGTVALVKSPKYWLARAFGGEVELERTKQRPKPGLEAMSGRIEKTKEVEKEVREEELEVGLMASFVG